MAEYHLFPKFPPELQLMIWDRALWAEASERLVILLGTTRRVVPMKHLWLDFNEILQQAFRNMEQAAVYSSGTIYLSVEWDTFVLCDLDNEAARHRPGQDTFSIFEPFWAAAEAELHNRPVDTSCLSWRYVTSMLHPFASLSISTLVLAESYAAGDYSNPDFSFSIGHGHPTPTLLQFAKACYPPFRYSLWRAREKWRVDIFQGIKAWAHLWLPCGTRSFLKDVKSKSARQLDIRYWQHFHGVDETGLPQWEVIDFYENLVITLDYNTFRRKRSEMLLQMNWLPQMNGISQVNGMPQMNGWSEHN
ncbi:hypothetical protein F5Y09DRAFT_337410 [Xylaria sp. FL1042]|nr:hypothetical protein F5Y09DRAFT_337410 [Xylaria sp. FL1042]